MIITTDQVHINMDNVIFINRSTKKVYFIGTDVAATLGDESFKQLEQVINNVTNPPFMIDPMDEPEDLSRA